ncbi:hypothetical protein [Algimonas porphyrae]
MTLFVFLLLNSAKVGVRDRRQFNADFVSESGAPAFACVVEN